MPSATARTVLAAAAVALAALNGCERKPPPPASTRPVRVVVMDPRADALSCACVPGFAQRRYAKLCEFLGRHIGRPVELLHRENLAEALALAGGRVDLVIGQRSLVEFDAAETATPVRPLLMLTDETGATGVRGLFVVRADDPAKTVADLAGRKVLIGPAEFHERHFAASAALRALTPAARVDVVDGDSAAALAVIDAEADAAVVSDYRLRLLVGCNVIDAGALRVLARTRARPFITVFATGDVDAPTRQAVAAALKDVKTDAALLTLMESRDGFVEVPRTWKEGAGRHVYRAVGGWTDWRGPGREAQTGRVPATLPSKPTFLWRTPLTGWGLSGVAATSRFVVVADKRDDRVDLWRCLDAKTGKEVWTLSYPAAEEMDYSNSPRATPVLRHGLAYLLGAFGDLHCVKLTGGGVVWKTNIIKQFGAELPQWGTCATPLIHGRKLIVNPGAEKAALVALDCYTGGVVWRTPGGPAAYASLYLSRFGGVEQIVGYDAVSLGGWDPATGRRLWRLLPPIDSDFNVPTPGRSGGRLVVATENNGTRVYGFHEGGRIAPEPVAVNEGLSPDTSSPVVERAMVFGVWEGLHCLDAADGLKTLWKAEDEAYQDYASLIAGSGRVLVTTVKGELLLVRAAAERYTLIARLQPFDYEAEVWSHPAIVGDRLYVRTQKEVVCLRLGP